MLWLGFKGCILQWLFLVEVNPLQSWYLSLHPIIKTPQPAQTAAIQINEWCHALTWNTIKRDFIILHSSLAAFHSPSSSLSCLIKKPNSVNCCEWWDGNHGQVCAENTISQFKHLQVQDSPCAGQHMWTITSWDRWVEHRRDRCVTSVVKLKPL